MPLTAVASLLTDPDAFFGARTDSLSLRGPLAVVAVLSVVNVASSLLLTHHLSIGNGLGADVATLSTAVGVVFGIVGMFVVWLAYAAVFHGVAVYLGGDADFRSVFYAVGWGFVPAVLGGLVNLFASWYALRGVSSSLSAARYLQQYQSHPVLTVAGYVGVAVLLWQGFLWAFAVSNVEDVELKTGALSVAAPVGVNVVWNLWTLV